MSEQVPSRPGPPSNPETAEFWAGLVDGRVRVQRCGTCGAAQHYPRARCRACWSDQLAWEDASGAATIWTFTVVHRPGNLGWQAHAPYAVVVAELAEGPRLVTGWAGDLARLTIGLPVRVGAIAQDGYHVVVSRPVAEEFR